MVNVRAPELPQHFTWINCDRVACASRNRPLSIKSLRGRIVILDFWTKGCINCLHVIPDLKYLEQKYSDYLTIIGVHSAKFEHEQHPDSVQQAVWRYEITHPVIVDSDRYIWEQYAVRAWPTFVVITALLSLSAKKNFTIFLKPWQCLHFKLYFLKDSAISSKIAESLLQTGSRIDFHQSDRRAITLFHHSRQRINSNPVIVVGLIPNQYIRSLWILTT